MALLTDTTEDLTDPFEDPQTKEDVRGEGGPETYDFPHPMFFVALGRGGWDRWGSDIVNWW